MLRRVLLRFHNYFLLRLTRLSSILDYIFSGFKRCSYVWIW
jgi:hypothetical protein